MASTQLDIPVDLWVKVGTLDPIHLGAGALTWPYDTRSQLADMLAEAAEELRRDPQGA